MSAVTIRAARTSDAVAIAQLTTQLGYDLTEEAAADRLWRILSRDDQRFFVADLGGRAIGWVHVLCVECVDAEAFVLIGGLVVDKRHRRLGVGRALMASAENWASERRCSMVRLTSSVTRTAAHKFYQTLGYTNIKTQFSFIKPLDPAAAARVSTFVPRVDLPAEESHVPEVKMAVDFRGLTPLIQVFDMPTSLRFYCDVLGFAVVTASGPLPNCGWALLRRNSDEIMLNGQFEDDHRPSAPDSRRQKAHNDTCFYFGCHDLDAAYGHLQAHGVAARKPSIAPYGMRQLYFADPDGFNLCFQHPVSKVTVEPSAS